MAETPQDIVDRELREFKRYTGDGLPNEPVNAPLPVGDPASGVWNPKKANLRRAVIAPLAETMAARDEAVSVAPSTWQDLRDETVEARDKSQEWAENPEDDEVEPGEYSALHHAAKAKEDALAASNDADRSSDEADRAELAADAATVNADVYPDTAAGLSGTIEGEQFQVLEGTDIVRYSHDAGPVATELVRYPSSKIKDLAYITKPAPNMISGPGNGEPYGWFVAPLDLVVEQVTTSDGRPATKVSRDTGTGEFYKSYNVRVPDGATKFSYHFAVESKTVTAGALRVLQYDDLFSSSISGGGTKLDEVVIAFASGATSTRQVYSGVVDVEAGAERVCLMLESDQATGEIVYSQAMIAFDANPEYREPQTPDFTDRAVYRAPTHFRNASTGLRNISVRFTYSPEVGVEFGQATGAVLYGDVGLRHVEGVAAEFETQIISSADSSPTPGALICVGEPSDNMVAVAYLMNGFVGVLDDANAIVTGGATGEAYEAGDIVRVRVALFGDGTGEITATGPSGATSRLAVENIPFGMVAMGLRANALITINWLTQKLLPADQKRTLQRISALEGSALNVSEPVFQTYHVLPDVYDDQPNQGWTCTGLDRFETGIFAGCWLIGDDGRLLPDTETDPGLNPQAGKAHVVSPDFSRILRTYDFEMPNSVQGVATCVDGTFWVAISTARQIRHYDINGEEIIADRMDWAGMGYSGNPNGIARDEMNDALWVTLADSNVARLIDCGDRSLLDTTTLGSSSPDQLNYDEVDQLLYYTTGGNGSNGSVRVHSIATGSDIMNFSNLTYVQAIEGVFIDRTLNTMWATSDGGFHIAARPALNIAIQHRVPVIEV